MTYTKGGFCHHSRWVLIIQVSFPHYRNLDDHLGPYIFFYFGPEEYLGTLKLAAHVGSSDGVHHNFRAYRSLLLGEEWAPVIRMN